MFSWAHPTPSMHSDGSKFFIQLLYHEVCCSCSVAANHEALSRLRLGFKSRREHYSFLHILMVHHPSIVLWLYPQIHRPRYMDARGSLSEQFVPVWSRVSYHGPYPVWSDYGYLRPATRVMNGFPDLEIRDMYHPDHRDGDRQVLLP